MPKDLSLNAALSRQPVDIDASAPERPPTPQSNVAADRFQQARSQVFNLTPLQMKAFQNGLSFSERRALLSGEPGGQSPESLMEKISAAQSAPVKLTRTVDRRSTLRQFNAAAAYLSASSAKNIVQARVSGLLNKAASGNSGAGLRSVGKGQLEKLLAGAKAREAEGNAIDLAQLLRSAGFSTRISNLNIAESPLLKQVSVDGLEFVNCHFDWIQFTGATLSGTSFSGCRLNNASFTNARLENCRFEDCVMRETMMTRASLRGVTFQRSDIVSGSFEDARVEDTHFDRVAMPGTHFLDARVSRSSISNSNLTNTAFLGILSDFEVDERSSATAVMTKPMAAILINPEVRGLTIPKVFMKLDQAAHNVPLRITMQPQFATPTEINREVEAALERVGEDTGDSLPIGQRLLRHIDDVPEQNAQLSLIVAKARKLGAHVNAIVLPGGEDVPPALYGAEQDVKTNWGGDYRRSILELSLIRESMTKGIPMLAICRGFQMANVYFGAQMQQHVKGHKGLQHLKLTDERINGLYGDAMRTSILSTVAHHQAIPVATQAPKQFVTPSVIYKDLVKATEAAHGGAAPAVMLQFHPEFYRATTASSLLTELVDLGQNVLMSSTNDAFWRILSDASAAHKAKKEVLENMKERVERAE
ncbi:MAG TPA: gamma-glutamyl-gamma-aminobutyrate hydrolase family protein [Paraburkholderia sp.]|nr:gamma-glutamyl-gamma-aminobutyrate hydrolase family protein [Paraburkholderia sp.]